MSNCNGKYSRNYLTKCNGKYILTDWKLHYNITDIKTEIMV